MSSWGASVLRTSVLCVGAAVTAVLYFRRRAAQASRTGNQSNDDDEHHHHDTDVLSTPFFPDVKALFALDFEGYTHLNHGSFGTVPKCVLAEKAAITQDVEAFPDDFYRRRALGRFKRAAAEVAALVGSPPENLTFVTNATTGVNSALRSVKWKSGDAILTTTITYNACANAARDLQERFGVEVVPVNLNLCEPGKTLSAADIRERACSAVSAALEAHPNIRVALVDHISSMPAITMPLKEISAVLRRHNVLILVDGAHAPGQLPLNLQDMDVDWYTGNLHKWAFSCKGSAFLYSAPSVRDVTTPVVVSHFWKMGLHERFFMQGTNDQTAYLAVPRVMSFVNAPQPEGLGGWDAVRSFNRELMLWATAHLTQLWGTEPLVSTDLSMCMCTMRTPLKWEWFMKPGASLTDAKADYMLGERIATAVWARSGIQCVFHVIGASVYTRISCQVYNTKADYVKYGKAVLELCAIMADVEGK